MSRRFLVALWAVLGVFVSPLQAQEPEAVPDPLALDIHAFVSQGVFISTSNNYLTESTNGSFELTEVGINFTKPITNDFRVGLQIFAHDVGNIGNFDAQLDWFYLDYRWRDWLGFRAGRVKLPFGLYNEIHDIDAARVAVLLPPSIYPLQNRDYFLAQTGVELYGYVDLGVAGALDYRVYGGTILLEVETQPGLPYAFTDITLPYVVGSRVLWEPPVPGLRIGGTLQALKIDLDLKFNSEAYAPLQEADAIPATFDGNVHAEIEGVLWVLSLEYVLRDLLVALEYTRTYADLKTSMPVLLPADDATTEGMYLMASYRFLPWFQPGAYYSLRFTDVDDRDRRSKRMHDTALTLRFDVTEHWLVKLEGHYLHGTVGLSPALNDGRPASQLEPDWFLFLAKTTAYF